MRKNLSWLSAFLLILCGSYLQGQVVVYNYPDTLAYSQSLGKNLRSFLYQVDIRQANKTYSSYVLADENTFPDGQRNLMTDWHHFSTFSFQGEIEVEITRLDGRNIQQATVCPLAFKVPFEYVGNKLKLRLTEPRKLYIELDGLEKQPLFLFADALEKDPPKPEASNVLLLKPGMSAEEVKNAITQSNRPIVFFCTRYSSFWRGKGHFLSGLSLAFAEQQNLLHPWRGLRAGYFLWRQRQQYPRSGAGDHLALWPGAFGFGGSRFF